MDIPHYITAQSSSVSVSSVVKLISYNASSQFQVLLMGIFFTVLSSMQPLVKEYTINGATLEFNITLLRAV